MRTTFVYLAIVVLTVAGISCSKSSGKTNTNELVGNWTFVSSQIKQVIQNKQQSSTINTNAVDSFNFTTVSNTGSVSFTADSILTKGLGYAVSTSRYHTDYNNGVVTNSSVNAYSMTIPPGYVSNSYLYIGKDTIYCPVMTFAVQTTQGTIPTAPGGAKYTLTGDTLVFTTITGTNASNTSGGLTSTIIDSAWVVTTLKRI